MMKIEHTWKEYLGAVLAGLVLLGVCLVLALSAQQAVDGVVDGLKGVSLPIRIVVEDKSGRK